MIAITILIEQVNVLHLPLSYFYSRKQGLELQGGNKCNYIMQDVFPLDAYRTNEDLVHIRMPDSLKYYTMSNIQRRHFPKNTCLICIFCMLTFYYILPHVLRTNVANLFTSLKTA